MNIKIFALITLVAIFPQIGITDTFVISDTEGSSAKLDTLIKDGKLRWITTPEGKKLDFVNPKDSFVFLGDLSGPDWVGSNPQNIYLRDQFLDFKKRYPARFDFIWGNHEANRFGFIRDNIRMERGEHPEYKKWLADKGLKDATDNRVTFWGQETYGMNDKGVAKPIADYQKELSTTLKREVSVKEAAERFAADLAIGKPGQKHGKMLELLLLGQESSYRSGYTLTHAPIPNDGTGVIPLTGTRSTQGASWLKERNDTFFRPQLEEFIKQSQSGNVPSPILSDNGDARWDNTAKRIVSDGNSLSYTERAMEGDQFRGVEPDVAKRFAGDTDLPSRGLISGHKPAGNFATAHRQEVNGKPFFDVAADTSRGADGMHSTVTIKDNGDLEISGKTTDGKVSRWTVNEKSDPLIGKITNDDFHIKGVTNDGKYILERYVGYHLEEKVVSKKSIDASKTKFSYEDKSKNKIAQGKIQDLETAINAKGGQVVDVSEASRVVGDRFVLDLRGATKWAAVDEPKAKLIRRQLEEMAKRLDPSKVIIMTGGNRSSNPNAVENMVHDIFGGKETKKKFDILGFMKNDTPADEVDEAVKYVVTVGSGDNWDGAVFAAQDFVKDRKGATVLWGGGGILERATETPAASAMKNRLILVQGFGGASEIKASNGTAVSSVDEILNQISGLDKNVVSPKTKVDGDKLISKTTKKQLKVGVYTGSFDPPHLGHKKAVEEMKKRFNLDVVYVVPEKGGQYKPGIKSLEDRRNMVDLMFKDSPGIQVIPKELELRTGDGNMWEVLKALKDEHPGAKVHNIMGTDTYDWYSGLPKDKQVDGVVSLVNQRKGSKKTNGVNSEKVQFVEIHDEGFSSSEVRKKIQANENVPELDKDVLEYSRKKNLYSDVKLSSLGLGPKVDSVTKTQKILTEIGHDEWRAGFQSEVKSKGGDVNQDRFRPVSLEPGETVASAKARYEKAGFNGFSNNPNILEQNINQPGKDIVPSLNHKLNGALAEDYAKTFASVSINSEKDATKMASDIHDIWMKHNSWRKADETNLFRPYSELTAVEKLKDLDVADRVIRVQSGGVIPESVKGKLSNYRTELDNLNKQEDILLAKNKKTLTEIGHDEWRASFQKDIKTKGGDINQDRFKTVPLEPGDTVASAKTRYEKAGFSGLRENGNILEQNINQPGKKIVPLLNNQLNGVLAEDYAKSFLNVSINSEADATRMASDIHDIWMKRNRWRELDETNLFRPYSELTAVEKLKDLDVADRVIRVQTYGKVPEAVKTKLTKYRSDLTKLKAREDILIAKNQKTLTEIGHDEWRASFQNDVKSKGGDINQDRFKPVPLEPGETVASAKARYEKAGFSGLRENGNVLEQNINQPGKDIVPSLNHKLNGALAEDYAKSFLNVTIGSDKDAARMSSDIHNIWMKHNGWNKTNEPQLFRSYGDLTAFEKLKDLDVAERVMRVQNNGKVPDELKNALSTYKGELLKVKATEDIQIAKMKSILTGKGLDPKVAEDYANAFLKAKVSNEQDAAKMTSELHGVWMKHNPAKKAADPHLFVDPSDLMSAERLKKLELTEMVLRAQNGGEIPPAMKSELSKYKDKLKLDAGIDCSFKNLAKIIP